MDICIVGMSVGYRKMSNSLKIFKLYVCVYISCALISLIFKTINYGDRLNTVGVVVCFIMLTRALLLYFNANETTVGLMFDIKYYKLLRVILYCTVSFLTSIISGFLFLFLAYRLNSPASLLETVTALYISIFSMIKTTKFRLIRKA